MADGEEIIGQLHEPGVELDLPLLNEFFQFLGLSKALVVLG